MDRFTVQNAQSNPSQDAVSIRRSAAEPPRFQALPGLHCSRPWNHYGRPTVNLFRSGERDIISVNLGPVRNTVFHPGIAAAPGIVPVLHAPEARTPDVAVVIPCYRVAGQILNVIRGIGEEVDAIYVIDDQCPDRSGRGGATITGMRQAVADGARVIVKVDGDGQMDLHLLPAFIATIRSGEADFAKGNRFYDPDNLVTMPPVRLVGNAILSFLAKMSTGYWQSFDPTNGYIAIHGDVARLLPLHKLHTGYFFETDLLFRLNTVQAKVVDIPMPALYAGEKSNLRVGRIILPFIAGHMRNFAKRILYNYFLRNFSIASLELIVGLALLLFGSIFGLAKWSHDGVAAPAGTVMLAGLPIILGVQLLLAFIAFDIASVPSTTLHPRLAGLRKAAPVDGDANGRRMDAG